MRWVEQYHFNVLIPVEVVEILPLSFSLCIVMGVNTSCIGKFKFHEI